MSGIPRFFELLKEIEDTHKRKNADYSSPDEPLKNLISSEKYFNVEGHIGTAIRMSDKWERFCNLLQREAKVTNESVKDTLLDLSIYCLLEIILIERYESKTKRENRGHTKKL